MPAYNEVDNIDEAITNVLRAVEGIAGDLEIIVIDDGSKDATGEIARKRSAQDKRIKCVTNEHNMGYGYSYRRGVGMATKEYVAVYTSDNDMHWESLRDLIANIGEADIISPYTSNAHERAFARRFFSSSFTLFMNIIFGLNMKYFNGPYVTRREILQPLHIRSNGLTVLAECKVKLMRQGYTCKEIPFTHVQRQKGKSSALSYKSIKAAFIAVWDLVRDVYFGGGK